MITKEALRKAMKARLGALPLSRFQDEGEAAAARLCEWELWSRSARVLLFLSIEREIEMAPLLTQAFSSSLLHFVQFNRKNRLSSRFLPCKLRKEPVNSRFFAASSAKNLQVQQAPGGLLSAGLLSAGVPSVEKTVYLPKPEGDSMRFFRAASPDGPWTVGAFGIREPADCTERTVFRPEDGPALVVTPGLAFDRRGNRMGRGRGYYDRFFAGLDAAGAEYYTVGFCLAEQLVDEVPVDRRDKRLDALCTPEGVLCFR